MVPAAISEQDTCYHIKAGNPWFAVSLYNSSCNSRLQFQKKCTGIGQKNRLKIFLLIIDMSVKKRKCSFICERVEIIRTCYNSFEYFHPEFQLCQKVKMLCYLH